MAIKSPLVKYRLDPEKFRAGIIGLPEWESAKRCDLCEERKPDFRGVCFVCLRELCERNET